MTAPRSSASVVDVDAADFEETVVARSHDVPVVVDFWASWCGPCRTLGPLLEQSVEARAGDVVLAKVDVDANPQLAARFGVQGIPAVKAFRDGRVIDEFVGAQPPRQVEAFLDRVVPSEADRAVALGKRLVDTDPDQARTAFEKALDLAPDHRAAAVALARLAVSEDPDRALELVRPHRPAPEAEQVATLAELARAGGDLDSLRARAEEDPAAAQGRYELGRALAASEMYEEAIEHLLASIENGDADVRESAREQLVALFPVIGEDTALVADARRRLARALF